MRRLSSILQLFFLISLITFSTPAIYAATVSVEGKLELWFEHNGHQATLSNAPSLRCSRQNDRVEIRCDLYRSEDGRYWIDRPEAGEYLLQVTASENGIQFYRKYPFKVDSSTTGPLLISLNRVMQIHSGSALGSITGNVQAGCDAYPRLEVPILSLMSMAGLEIAWESLADADRYYYKIWRARCENMKRYEPVLIGSVRESVLRESIPKNDSGEFYFLQVFARNGSQDIGQLLYGNGEVTASDAYPFVVSDPLGSRDWLPVALLALLIPMALWFVWWMLSGITLARPGKDFVWMMLIAIVGIGGYLQRDRIVMWVDPTYEALREVEEFSQKWYRSSDTDSGYTVNRPITDGEWRGYLVAVGSEPFYGSDRRLEMRISFEEETAQVSVLKDGRWQAVSREGFTISKSTSGMNLFAHLRGRKQRELWSISIPDIHEATWGLNLDRVITRNDGKEKTVRRQAIGELRHTFP